MDNFTVGGAGGPKGVDKIPDDKSAPKGNILSRALGRMWRNITGKEVVAKAHDPVLTDSQNDTVKLHLPQPPQFPKPSPSPSPSPLPQNQVTQENVPYFSRKVKSLEQMREHEKRIFIEDFIKARVDSLIDAYDKPNDRRSPELIVYASLVNIPGSDSISLFLEKVEPEVLKKLRRIQEINTLTNSISNDHANDEVDTYKEELDVLKNEKQRLINEILATDLVKKD